MNARVRRAGPVGERGTPPRARVLVLGGKDRGDDAVGPLVAERLESSRGWAAVRAHVDLRMAGALDVLDVADTPSGTSCIVVDAARGLEPGEIAFIPFERFLDEAAEGLPVPRSSHELPVATVLGLARIVRGELPDGGFLVGGGAGFGLGQPPSGRTLGSVPRLADRLMREVARRCRPDDQESATLRPGESTREPSPCALH